LIQEQLAFTNLKIILKENHKHLITSQQALFVKKAKNFNIWVCWHESRKRRKYDMGVIKKTVVIHPIMDSYIRKTWAILIESGKDASYSSALNFMLLATIFVAQQSEGLTDKTKELLWNFIDDKETMDELNLQESLATYEENIKPGKSKNYIV